MRTTFLSGALITQEGVIFVTRMDDGTWCRQSGFSWIPVPVGPESLFVTQRRAFGAVKRFGGRRLATGVFATPKRTLEALRASAMPEGQYVAFRTEREAAQA